ncbi:helix-turn-helix transcriptional regulator [Streptomyces benahoarensis]|uniref:helix-turn-helix transcriptional regulator n=1 Tax=Streptomyces benahoarensis TaxID=2595054 RepID=UPI00163D3FCD|nr:helix-turn-helix transcriptional regulator [Streptomyces benahoarensis]
MDLAKRRKAMGYSQEKFAHEIGVDRTTAGRWERGETAPEAGMRPKIAELLHLDLIELDVMLNPAECEGPATSPSDVRHDSGDIDDMIRREFLRLIAVTGALSALPPDEVNALSESGETAGEFHRMNSHLWKVYQLARSKSSISPVVQDQLSALTETFRSGSPRRTEVLCEAAGDLFQLAGELAFDRNRYTDATASYTLAASASSNARAHDLWACALVRHAYVDLYAKRFSQAAETLEVAGKVATHGDSALSTRYWVASVQSEAYAGLRNEAACEKALDEAQRVTDLKGTVHNGGWLRFDGSRLLEERGARYLQVGRLDLAESTLKTALATDALAKGASFRRRGVVLVDLASIGAKRRDAEQVTAYGGEALQLAQRTRSGYVARRLQALRAEIGSLGREPRVAELGAAIGALRTP